MGPLVGRAVERTEDLRFLKGKGQYIDDVDMPGMAHAVVLRSPIAHARIRQIDASAARALPGVIAVLTFADIAETAKPIPVRIYKLPGFERFLQMPLAETKVRYVGEPVALVIAETPHIAEDALELIEVDYDLLGPVVDLASARQESHLHEAVGSNIASNYTVSMGDPETAFQDADYRRREKFRCHRHTAVPMETRGLLAAWDESTGRLQVWGAAKVPFANRAILAGMLGLPNTAVDMIEVDVGGSFGVRGEFYPEDFLIPFAARLLKRPVKWIEDRREHLSATNHSREMDCELEIACRKDGTILGMRGHLMADMGAYVRTNGGVVAGMAIQFLPGPYRIPNFACELTAFLSNKTPVGTYRGPGRFESSFFRERLLDMAAADLGMDAGEFRRINLYTSEELPRGVGDLVPGEAEHAFDSGDFPVPLQRALEEIRWNELQPLQGKEIDGWYHGLGFGCFVESGGAGPRENAKLRLEPDGKISLFVGCSATGQGHETLFAQICADVLSLPMDRFQVFHGSTTYLEEGFGTYHGRAAIMGGSAVLDAATRFAERLRTLAADRLGRPNQELIWDEGRFSLAEGDKSVDLAELAAGSQTPIEEMGRHSSTKVAYSYGTHACHLAVDAKTGRVKILDYVAVEDLGRVLNPLIVHGQAMGALVQGLGGTFLDEMVYDAEGQLLCGSFADYLLPTASDFDNLRCITLELAPSPVNPLGVKAAGEGGIVPVAAVIGNAITAALSSFGVQVRDLPLSPSKVWSLLQQDAASAE